MTTNEPAAADSRRLRVLRVVALAGVLLVVVAGISGAVAGEHGTPTENSTWSISGDNRTETFTYEVVESNQSYDGNASAAGRVNVVHSAYDSEGSTVRLALENTGGTTRDVRIHDYGSSFADEVEIPPYGQIVYELEVDPTRKEATIGVDPDIGETSVVTVQTTGVAEDARALVASVWGLVTVLLVGVAFSNRSDDTEEDEHERT